MNKICKDCKVEKNALDYYGAQNDCKDCFKARVRSQKNRFGTLRDCVQCDKEFKALQSEIDRGGGKVCSRACYYLYQPKMLDDKWTGKRKYYGLHRWVYRQLGQPSKCEMCLKNTGKFEWSNISGEYREDIADWQRLCIKCHRNYDQTGTKAWITRRANLTKERIL